MSDDNKYISDVNFQIRLVKNNLIDIKVIFDKFILGNINYDSTVLIKKIDDSFIDILVIESKINSVGSECEVLNHLENINATLKISLSNLEKYYDDAIKTDSGKELNLLASLALITSSSSEIKLLLNKVSSLKTVFDLEGKLQEAKIEVNNIKSAKAALEGQKTEEIYSEAYNIFSENSKVYETLFYLLVFGLTLFTIISLIQFPYNGNNLVNFVAFKIIVVSLLLTLGTIFLRRAAHNRKLATQAHQTSLELQALPLFTRSLTDEQKQQVYLELAGKYFGKEIDQTQQDKIGDVLQDQMKLSTELLKASLDVVKAVKPQTPTKPDE